MGLGLGGIIPRQLLLGVRTMPTLRGGSAVEAWQTRVKAETGSVTIRRGCMVSKGGGTIPSGNGSSNGCANSLHPGTSDEGAPGDHANSHRPGNSSGNGSATGYAYSNRHSSAL